MHEKSLFTTDGSVWGSYLSKKKKPRDRGVTTDVHVRMHSMKQYFANKRYNYLGTERES